MSTATLENVSKAEQLRRLGLSAPQRIGIGFIQLGVSENVVYP